MQDVRISFRASAPLAEALALRTSMRPLDPSSVAQNSKMHAQALCRQLACAASADVDDIFDALRFVPLNLLVLLESPQGWTVLASYLAADLDLPPSSYKPTVH